MVEYKCEKCHRIFDHKHNFLYHQNKKKSCIPTFPKIIDQITAKNLLDQKFNDIGLTTSQLMDIINKPNDDEQLEDIDMSNFTIYNPEFIKPICVYCNKHFLTNSHRNRHMNLNCNIRKKYIELLKTLDSEIENQYLENKLLRNKILELYGDNTLFTFGTEKFSTYDMNLVSDSIKNPYRGIPKFIESYHFNTLEPRYNNVRIKNPKGTHFEIYNGMSWVMETRERTIQILLRTYKDIIDMEVENFNGIISSHFIKNYNDFSENIDIYLSFIINNSEISPFQKKKSKPYYLKIYSEIELMFINIFRKEITNKLEEDLFNNIKKK